MNKGDFLLNIRNYKILRKILLRLNNNVVKLPALSKPKGNVLISYTTLPFVTKSHMEDGHTNRWECKEIVRIFRDKGYNVDVIDWTDTKFKPSKKYKYFVDIHKNLERLASEINPDCIKILHLTTSSANFQNKSETGRLEDLKKRRGVSLTPRRQIPESKSIELADETTMLGNSKTASTYEYFHKDIRLIPISTTHVFSSPDNKDFEKIKKNFIWLGGSGMVHKGLDLVLEAFSQMPDYYLKICGKIESEKDFCEVYKNELFETPNIFLAGLVDLGSKKFRDIANDSLGLIYPSASEGQSGAVVSCIHAGLIPIISEHSGVNVENFGFVLDKCNVQEIMEKVKFVSNLSTPELKQRALKAWDYANKNHTRQKFSVEYSNFVKYLEHKYA